MCSRTRWKLKGDAVTKEFFRAVREPSGTTQISTLRDHSGARVTDRTELENLVLSYYRALYAELDTTLISTQAEVDLLALIPTSFSD